jgi:hypothetical protein
MICFSMPVSCLSRLGELVFALQTSRYCAAGDWPSHPILLGSARDRFAGPELE